MNASQLISTALDELLTPTTKLSDILFKIKAIGHFIGNEELKSWATLQLSGYGGTSVEIPSYRRIGAVPRVNLVHEDFSFNGAQQSNQTMVVEYLDAELRDSLTHRYIGQSVAEIEQFASQENNPRINIPHPIFASISEKIYEPNGWHIHSAWQVLPVNHLVALLTTIRSKLVDLLLELDQLDKDVSLQTLQGKQAATETVSKALNSTVNIHGGNVNFSQGDGAVQAANSGDAAQLNTAGNDATQSIAPAQADSLRELVEQLKQAVAQDAAFDGHREEIEQEVERIEVQLQKPEPKKSIMKRAFESLQDLAVKGAGVATGHAVYELLKQAPALLDAIS
ncbi:MAG: hypothetical protein JWP58_1792 [Hymenobacter sp.]|nr:hypothetical protein [Hymenobacter sp.]